MNDPRPSPRPPRPNDPRRNSVGLDERALAEMFDRFDASSPASAPPQRTYKRFAFRHTCIPLEVAQGPSPAQSVLVASRNISLLGMSVVHSAYMHVGTRCTALLPRTQGQPLRVAAIVARCCHRTGRIHEIGLKFEHAIDLDGLLHLDPWGDWGTLERVEPAGLQGTIVHAAPSERDRDIVRHFVRDASVSIRKATSIAEALTAAEGADLLLAEYQLADGTADALRDGLDKTGLTIPMIVIAPGMDERAGVEHVRADGFLVKPLEQTLLLRVLGEFLVLGREPQSVPADPPAPDVLEASLRELARHAQPLVDAGHCGDAAALREICRHMNTAATAAGLTGLAREARTIAEGTGKIGADTLSSLRVHLDEALAGRKKAA